MVGGACVLGTCVSTWQAIEASRARNAEKQQRLAAQTERDKAQTAEQAEKRARLQADAERAEAAHLLYVANMNLAQQAWDQNNIGRLRQLLEDTQDSPHRGFEWYYWQPQTHLALKTLRGHWVDVPLWPSPRTASGLSPAVATRRPRCGTRPAAGNCSRSKGTAMAVNSVAFSPDGQRIVTGSEDRRPRCGTRPAGNELLTLKGHRR